MVSSSAGRRWSAHTSLISHACRRAWWSRSAARCSIGHRQATPPARFGSSLEAFTSCGSRQWTSPSASRTCWTPFARSSLRGRDRRRVIRKATLSARPGEDPFVRGDFGGIVQRRELRDTTPREGAPDQVVGQVRVLRQQRAVKVGAQDASLQAAFGVVLAVVAEAHAHASEGLGLRPEVGAAAVILEADESRRLEVGQLAIGGLVVVAEQLVAATDGEHASAGGYRALEWSLLRLEEVVVHERLLAILAAAEEEDIDVFHAPGGATPELDEARIVVAPFGALEQGEDVAPIAVDVHEVGVKPNDGEPRLGHLLTSPSTVSPNRAGRARSGCRASLYRCRAGARSRLRASL